MESQLRTAVQRRHLSKSVLVDRRSHRGWIDRRQCRNTCTDNQFENVEILRRNKGTAVHPASAVVLMRFAHRAWIAITRGRLVPARSVIRTVPRTHLLLCTRRRSCMRMMPAAPHQQVAEHRSHRQIVDPLAHFIDQYGSHPSGEGRLRPIAEPSRAIIIHSEFPEKGLLSDPAQAAGAIMRESAKTR